MLRSLLRGATDSATNRGRAARLMSATALGQGLSLLTAPLLTRWLGLESFGTFGLYLAALGSLSGAVSWRLGLAIPGETDEREARAVLAAGVLASFVSAIVVAIAVAVFAEPVAHRWFARPGDGLLLWWLAPALLGVAIADVLGGWGLRHRTYQALVHQRVARSMWTAGWQLAHGFVMRFSPVPLVVGDAVGRIASVVPMAAMAWRHEREKGPLPSWAEVRASLRKHREFLFAATPANLINKIGEWVPVFLLGAWWDAGAAGLFIVGQRLVGVPIGLIGDSAGQVYVAELAAAQRGDRSALVPLYVRYAKALGGIAAIAAVLLMVATGPTVFAFALGADWADSGRMVRWQSLALAFQLVAIPMAHTLVVLRFPRRQLAWDIARLAASIGVFALAHRSGWTAVGAVALFGAVSAALYAGLVGLSYAAVRERAAERVADAAPQSAGLPY